MLTRRYPIDIDTARDKIQNLTIHSQTEVVSVSEANHRVLAEDATAPFDYPHFRRSGYDGYAVRTEDDHDYPRDFHVVGDIPAGATFDRPLNENETVRIMTGAFVPENAGKVIMLEQTRAIPDRPNDIHMVVTEKHSNITERGTEFKTGDPVISANTMLNPGGLAILTALGVSTVTVFRQPRVAIITTGTELMKPGEPLTQGKIYNSNGVLIENLVRECGGLVTENKQLIDDYDLLKTTLNDALASDNDLIITDGGVSVGDYDFLAEAATASDNLLFNKLKMRPGSVTTAFVQQQTLVMALSGNPGACFTAFYLFVEPFLQRFVQQPSRVTSFSARLGAAYKKTNGFDRILRGTFDQVDGEFIVFPNGSDQSGALANLQSTTCLIKIPHSNTPLSEGAEVQAWQLPFK